MGANIVWTSLAGAELSDASCLNTTFARVDLSFAVGLDKVRHIGPSDLGVQTILASEGKIPDAFLRGCGFDPRIQSMLLGGPAEISDATQEPVRADRQLRLQSCFISYSSKDKEFVLRLATDLRTREGIDAWLDQWETTPGDRIPERIEEGLSEASVFILVLSPDSVRSQWVEYERQAWLMMQIDEEKRAKEESRLPKRRLIPVLYRNCQKPAFLQPIHHVRFSDQDYEDGFKRLVSAVLGISGKPPLKEKVSPAVVVPPPGARRKYVLTLLKTLFPGLFNEVIFIYDMPSAYLPTNTAQVQKAIALIEYAEQREGEDISGLLDSIYTVAPHLKGGR